MQENYVAVGLKKIIEDNISFKNDLQITDEEMIAIYDVDQPGSGTLPYTIIREKDLTLNPEMPIKELHFYFSNHENG